MCELEILVLAVGVEHCLILCVCALPNATFNSFSLDL